MKRILLITLLTFTVGMLSANAQVDEDDPTTNTEFQRNLDSVENNTVIDDPAELDTSITDGAIVDTADVLIDPSAPVDKTGAESDWKDASPNDSLNKNQNWEEGKKHKKDK
jgi:hypothetical protein